MNSPKQNLHIYSGDWKKFHPYSGSAPTDFYYITLANKVLNEIHAIESALPEDDLHYIGDNEQIELACILTAYFEDIISQTGIFQAFAAEHTRRFGKPLPFYPATDEYAPGEINTDEVRFLIWHYYMQINNLDIPFSPALSMFAEMAEKTMQLFEEEYETAPENKKFRQYFDFNDKEAQNLYALHSKSLWLCTQSYLFFSNGYLLQEIADDIVTEAKEAGNEEQISQAVDMACTDFGFNHVTELMNLTPAQWLARVVGEGSPAYLPLKGIGRMHAGYFRYEGEDAHIIRFRHIATDRIIEASLRSVIGMPREMKDPESILYTGFVLWNGEWWLVGQIIRYEGSEELLDQISSNDDEYSLFEPETELPEEEQQVILDDILNTAENEDGEPLDTAGIAWQAMLSDEIGKNFFLSQVQGGHINGLQFYQDEQNLLLDSLTFVTEYVKR